MPALMLIDVVDGAGVRVIQRRGGAGFALESLDGLSVPGVILGEEFQGNPVSQPCILGFENDAHPAAAEFVNNPVVRNRGANHQMGICPEAAS